MPDDELPRFMESIRDSLVKYAKNKIEQLTLDQIIDIYEGKYSCYEEYIDYMYKLKEEIRLMNIQDFNKNSSNGSLSFKYYAEPPILNKNIFDYIRFKRMKKYETNTKNSRS